MIGWLALAFAAPGLDWLIVIHTIFISIAGICTLLSSVSISAHFVERRGLVTYEQFNFNNIKYEFLCHSRSLISGAQLTGSIWYAIFQVNIIDILYFGEEEHYRLDFS